MGKVFDAIVIGLYPLIVLVGLNYLNVRWTALLILALLGRRIIAAVLMDKGASAIVLVQALLMTAIITAAGVSGSEIFLRFTPFLISLTFLGQFGLSLRGTPIIERFARLKRPELPADHVVYCRKLTKAWLVVLFGNSVLVLVAAFVESSTVWAILVGPVSYFYWGTFIVIEFIFRKWRFQEFDPDSMVDRLLKPLVGRDTTP